MCEYARPSITLADRVMYAKAADQGEQSWQDVFPYVTRDSERIGD